jgi:hypothetical protein
MPGASFCATDTEQGDAVATRRRRPGGGEDRDLLTGLTPLRWLADEDLVYEPATETLHRAGCRRLVSPETARALAAGTALERMTAPRFCECRPDVTTTLSAPRLDGDAGGRGP